MKIEKEKTMEKITNSNGKIYAYLRVSWEDHSLEKQQHNLETSNYLIEQIFQDETTGKERPNLQQLMEIIQEGDWVVVTSLDRICRSTKDLCDLIVNLREKGIKLISLKENLDVTTAFEIQLLSMIAEIERSLSKERQKEGIEQAKKRGIYRGRKKVEKPENFDECFQKYLSANRFYPYTIQQFCQETKLKTATLYRFLNEIKEKEKGKLLQNV